MLFLILAGGQGTRLWPLSRKQKPKQFQRLVGSKTMLQESVARISEIAAPEDIYIATNKEYRTEVERELKTIPRQNIIAEPLNRERLASILFFLAASDKNRDDEPVLIAPADHVIRDIKVFLRAVRTANDFIIQNPDYIIQLGEKPNFPDTGLGYIKQGKIIDKIAGTLIFKVDFFKEKPNLERTAAYVKDGSYFWNTGIYMAMPELLEKLSDRYVPDNYQRYLKIKELISGGDNDEVIEEEYAQMDKTSLEYSIIENYDKVAMISTNMGWSDVGSWAVLKNVLSSPTKSYAKGNFIDVDCENVMVYGSFDKLVAGVGIRDLIIVVTDDIVLVCNRNDSQKVKKIIDKLEKQKKFNYI